ncbi:MAG: FAD-dependent oxidoreductase, partial [Leptospiraceae bacterium]|nr:FAD-dependent oxidoreductase [Leptospiraceae bacterium]
ASFIGPNTIEVTSSSGVKRQYHANAFVIGTGARPYHPPDVDFTNPRILDSDTILNLETSPRSLTIYGAGVIGCEYASIFRGLRIKVNLVNTRDRLLSFLDDEIIDALSYHLSVNGVLIRHNEEYERVEANERGVTLFLKSNKRIQSDYLLWANGRTGNSDNMGLEELNIGRDSRGNIVVNENYQTAQAHIYAVGDVIGFP